MKLTYKPKFVQNLSDEEGELFGLATKNTSTEIGSKATNVGRRETLIPIVHEEMHHRMWQRRLIQRWIMWASVEEKYVESIAKRFANIKMISR